MNVVRFPEAHILDKIGQTAASVVAIIQHYTLQVTVQHINPER